MLDLEHRALSRLIRGRRGLGNHAIKAGALEALQPVEREVAFARHRREVERATDLLEELLEPDTTLLLWHVQQIAAINCQQIERHKGCRSGLGEFRDAGSRGMQSHLQPTEIESMRGWHDDLAVHDDAAR